MSKYRYEIIRSRRKSLGLEIRPDGRLIVRAPMQTGKITIDRFVTEHETWIARHMAQIDRALSDARSAGTLTEGEIEELAQKALKLIPERVKYYAPIVGVDYGRITIRNQRTRWGSCSAKGNLNFNCLLMLTPPEVIDSVVVHELCHRLEMNHSKRFYEEVLRAFPDYRKWNRWLKEHGNEIMARMP